MEGGHYVVKYRGLILRVTRPALGSNDLNLDQSGTSIQILQEPNAGHVTRFLYNYVFNPTPLKESLELGGEGGVLHTPLPTAL